MAAFAFRPYGATEEYLAKRAKMPIWWRTLYEPPLRVVLYSDGIHLDLNVGEVQK